MGVEDRRIKFTLTTGSYSIDDFNGKVKAAVLQQRQDWEAHQTKDLKNYTLMASNNFLLHLVYSITILKSPTCNKSTLPPWLISNIP